jgi:hypothetical protein
MLRNFAHDFDILCLVHRNLSRCATIEKGSAEESRLRGVDEITCMSFVCVYRQICFVHVCTCACTEIDLVCLRMCMTIHNLVHISAREVGR